MRDGMVLITWIRSRFGPFLFTHTPVAKPGGFLFTTSERQDTWSAAERTNAGNAGSPLQTCNESATPLRHFGGRPLG